MTGWGKRGVSLVFAILVVSSLVTMPVLAGGSNGIGADGRVTASEPDAPVAFQPGGDNGPGGPGGGGPPGHERGSEANVSIPVVDANTTVELLREARTDIEAIEASGAKAAAARENAIAAINASIGEYRKLTFADSEEALEYQRDAQKELDQLAKRVSEPATRNVENASTTLYRASNVTSRLATREAYELVRSSEGSFDTPGQRQAAESALGNAAGALERATDKSGAKGTVHLRTAWREADRAVEIVEANVEPELTVEQGPAFERNETVEVLVSVEITDARPYAYDEATVTIGGNESETIDLWTEPVAGGSATGHYYVDVGEELTNRSVAVSATANHDPSRAVEETLDLAVTEANVITQPPAPDEVTEVEVDDESGATVTTRGPGLQAGDVSISTVTPEANPDAYASPIIDVQNATAFHNATVSIPVNASRIGDGNLSIVHFGTGTEDGWQALETEIDEANATAVANVTSFSRFAVMNDREIIDSITEYASPGWPVLEDFSSLDGWQTTGTVSHDDRLAVVESESQDGGSPGEPGDPGDPGEPSSPVAEITGPSEREIGQSGTWSAADSTGAGLSYDWGGSVSGTGVTVSETFYYGGTTEQITLTVTDEQGRTDSTTKNVQITCPGSACPQPDAANKTNVTTSGLVEEDATDSKSADGTHASSMSRTFSIDDGAESVEVNARVLAELRESEGVATVRITGESGNSKVLFQKGEPDDGSPGEPDGPVAKVSGPSEREIGQSGTWSATGSTGDGLSYDWGGSVDGSGPTVTETFYYGGTTERITLTVTDEQGRTDSTTKKVQITCPGSACPEPEAADETVKNPGEVAGTAAVKGDEPWVDVSADISEFAGEEVTVTFEAADGATLATEYVGVLADSTGSGLPDAAEEMDLHMPPIGEGRYLFSELNLDPTVADTDDDGLRDGEEVDIATDYVETASGWQLRGIVTDASSHPFRTGTDGDGLSDYEEAERWGTDPLLADTSGDGFNDAVDPAPLEKTTLPDVRYKSNDWYNIVEDELIVEARPTGGATEIEEITVEKHVDSTLRFDDEWQTATVRDTDDDGAWLEKTFYFLDERKFAWGEPDRIIVTVEDEDGNTVEIDHDLDTGQSAIAAGTASAGAFATVTKPAFAFPVSRETVIGITVGIGLGATAYAVATTETIEGEETEAKLERPVPETEEVDSWTLAGEGMEITLPAGAVYESVGDHHRGFGWEYIQETTDVRLSAVWNTIQDPEEVIREDDEVRYIIGESLSEDEKIILEIIGGTVVAASHQSVYNEDCDATIRIDTKVGDEWNPEHATRDVKPIDELTTLKDILENPKRIVDGKGQGQRYFIKKLDSGKVILVATDKISDYYQGLITTLTGKGKDNAFKTVDDAMDEIDNRENTYEIIHDPEEGVEC